MSKEDMQLLLDSIEHMASVETMSAEARLQSIRHLIFVTKGQV